MLRSQTFFWVYRRIWNPGAKVEAGVAIPEPNLEPALAGTKFELIFANCLESFEKFSIFVLKLLGKQLLCSDPR